MQYREDKYHNKISILGYGCMRFTRGIKTDVAKAEREIMIAYNNGVNYFDTAYIYPGSEVTLGAILEKNKIREKVRIATKLPHYMIKSLNDLDKKFNEQLSRLRTNYIDYYYMHMLTDEKTFDRLAELGVLEWLEKQKELGRIKQIGFSYHGNTDSFCKLLDVYPWDITMIQYNYMDENSQAGVKGLKYSYDKGIPVVIMEPLRGGKLVDKLPKTVKTLMSNNEKKYTPAEWSFNWIWNQKEPITVLSGMNSVEMVEENCKAASNARVGFFGEKEQDFLEKVKLILRANTKVQCTGCGYCMPCPAHVDIPGTFAAYNNSQVEGKMQAVVDYFMCTAIRKDNTAASNCIECGKCELHCPQDIKIQKELKEAQKMLEGPLYKIGKKILPLFMKY